MILKINSLVIKVPFVLFVFLQILVTSESRQSAPICQNTPWDGQKCVQCPIQCICTDSQNYNQCNSCLPGYYMTSKSDPLTGTKLLSCQSCPIFDLNRNIACKTCCISDQSRIEICSECPSTGYFVGGICKSCIDNCISCSDSATCTRCITKYFLKGGICQKCNNLCTECASEYYCTTCIEGYELISGVCTACTISNCSQCQKGQCLSCKISYFLKENNCIYIAGCESLDEQSLTGAKVQCKVCFDGFYLETQVGNVHQGECISCDQKHLQEPRILVCQDTSPVPIQCLPGYVLVQKTCEIDMGCRVQLAGQLCSECYEGRFLDDGMCHTCSEAHAHCTECIIGGVYTKARCLTCQSGFFLDTISRSCRPCSYTIPNCIKCEGPNSCETCSQAYTLSPSQDICNKCPDQNCLSCPAKDTCDVCVAGFVLNEITKKCVTCGIANCNQCTYDISKLKGFCTECKPDFVLEEAATDATTTTTSVIVTSSTNSTTVAPVYTGNCIVCVDSCVLCQKQGICQKCAYILPRSYYLTDGGKSCINTGCALSDGVNCILCKYGYYYLEQVCVRCDSDIDSRINCPKICQSNVVTPIIVIPSTNTSTTNETTQSQNQLTLQISSILITLIFQFLI